MYIRMKMNAMSIDDVKQNPDIIINCHQAISITCTAVHVLIRSIISLSCTYTKLNMSVMVS